MMTKKPSRTRARAGALETGKPGLTHGRVEGLGDDLEGGLGLEGQGLGVLGSGARFAGASGEEKQWREARCGGLAGAKNWLKPMVIKNRANKAGKCHFHIKLRDLWGTVGRTWGQGRFRRTGSIGSLG